MRRALCFSNNNRKDLLTDRLLLRDVKDSDKKDLFILYSDNESSLLDDWEPMVDESEAEEKIARMRKDYESNEGISFMITDRKTGLFYGCCGVFNMNPESSNCCIFYQIDKRYRNQGYATEAIQKLTEYCIIELKIHRIYAYITPGNDASIRVLEKCGYQKEGLLREMEFYKGKYWDGILMALLESDLKNENHTTINRRRS